ncbi:hypothetical protein [Enterococcus rotai]|uniref:hypothetical protein n=1 Tax=Enterococcus rotai TaxID=118060 RepID=UPI0035C772DA
MKKKMFCLLVLFLAFLHIVDSVNEVYAETMLPPVGYPLGVSTKTNLAAGGTLYFNTDQLQEKQLVGQFLARNITSNGSSGLTKSGFQNYQNATRNWELDQIDPAVVSETITGSDVIRWYANSTSFKYVDGEDLHYYLGHLPTENELNEALQQLMNQPLVLLREWFLLLTLLTQWLILQLLILVQLRRLTIRFTRNW